MYHTWKLDNLSWTYAQMKIRKFSTFGLSNLRTIEPSDYRTYGLSNLRTFGLPNLWTIENFPYTSTTTDHGPCHHLASAILLYSQTQLTTQPTQICKLSRISDSAYEWELSRITGSQWLHTRLEINWRIVGKNSENLQIHQCSVDISNWKRLQVDFQTVAVSANQSSEMLLQQTASLSLWLTLLNTSVHILGKHLNSMCSKTLRCGIYK